MSDENVPEEEEEEEETEEKTDITTTRTKTDATTSRPFDDVVEDFKRTVDYLTRPWYEVISPEWFSEFEPVVRYPSVDLVDNGDSYTVKAEMPGITKKELKINVTKEGLDITAEAVEDKEEKGKQYIHRERSYTSFRRYLVFPKEVIPNKAKAEIKNGILTVKIPKKEPTTIEKPVKVEIKEG
ncbi:MAG: Hsp20/alpha crystallin family protein [Candidatus Freyarchaeum deiterrae]